MVAATGEAMVVDVSIIIATARTEIVAAVAVSTGWLLLFLLFRHVICHLQARILRLNVLA